MYQIVLDFPILAFILPLILSHFLLVLFLPVLAWLSDQSVSVSIFLLLLFSTPLIIPPYVFHLNRGCPLPFISHTEAIIIISFPVILIPYASNV